VEPERTELEWTYEPTDLFEAPYNHAQADFDLLLDSGRAVATLTVPQDPIPQNVENRIRVAIEDILLVQQFQTRRKYGLDGPKYCQYSEGRKHLAIRPGGIALMFAMGQVDLVATDARGNIIRESKKERITEHSTFLDAVSPKLARSPTLRSMFESYSRSINDPGNELFHLYEVRDALVNHFGGEQSARDTLGISQAKWGRLGILANVEPLEEGRHRGKHPIGRRPATDSELNDARNLVQCWIMEFAKTV
jgi:hypothetical protein